MRKGEIEEFGVFPDGTSGYGIGKGETADAYRNVSMFHPYILSEVHEIILFEKHKEIIREVLQFQIDRLLKKGQMINRFLEICLTGDSK